MFFAATKIQKQAPQVFCKRRSVTLLLERGSIINAKFLRTLILKNICERLLVKISISVTRSSRPEVFCKKGVLRNLTKFTEKHLCQSLLYNKVAGMRLWHRCFLVNFVKFLRSSFFTEHLLSLPLQIYRREIIPEFYQAYPFKFCYD